MQDQRALIADILRSQMSEQPAAAPEDQMQVMQSTYPGAPGSETRRQYCVREAVISSGEGFDMQACMMAP